MTTPEYSDIAKLEQRNRNVKKNTITTNILKKSQSVPWVFTIKEINQWSDACQAHFITTRRSEWDSLFDFNFEDYTK